MSPKTKWPDAAPLDEEEMIFSISCGNSHLHWATHYGDADDYNPQIFWRTPHLKEEDIESEDFLSVLSRNLPDDPHDYIFGKSVDATEGDAETQAKTRAAPLISVYVVSTNASQEALLAKIWKTVPSRLFVMRGDDFFKKEEGRYDTMGTDRLATLTGAVHLHGHPALVFDGGTATTYSATDGAGKILGGGIGPGIQSKFRSLTKDTDTLPEISSEEVIARVNEAQEKGKPLPTFARNTQEAMMADAFQEFALKGRNVIEHWLEKAYKDSKAPAELKAKVNDGKRVICTGGDGDILMQLLQPHYGGVIEHMGSENAKSRNGSSDPRYIVESSKHLIHYGIACVLAAHVSLRKKKEESRKEYEDHVGKRVAKIFEVEADDGDNIFRGKVLKVVEVEEGDPEFCIQYDDGDREDVTLKELSDILELFTIHGEKETKKATTNKGKSSSQKKKEIIQNEEASRGKVNKETATPEKTNAQEGKAVPEKVMSQKEKPAPEKASAQKKSSTPEKPSTPKQMGVPEKSKNQRAKAMLDEADAQKAKSAPAKPDAQKAKFSSEKAAPAKENVKKPKATVEKLGTGNTKKPGSLEVPDVPSVSTRPGKKRSTTTPTGTRKPPAKKAKTVNDIMAMVNGSNPKSFVRKRIAKNFDGETYFGTIMEYDDSESPAYWHVEYDDGDEEDFSKKDLIKALKHYEKNGKHDTNKGD